jgi:hypothetical protein
VHLRARNFDRLSRAIQERIFTDGDHHAGRLSAAYRGSRIERIVGLLPDFGRFASERRLVALQVALEELYVGGHEIPAADTHHVARDELAGR